MADMPDTASTLRRQLGRPDSLGKENIHLDGGDLKAVTWI